MDIIKADISQLAIWPFGGSYKVQDRRMNRAPSPQLVKDRKLSISIGLARFVTHEEDGRGTPGPVVIWIGVHPGSTAADTAHEVSQNILELLEKNGVKDVEVEWHEVVSWMAAF
ncbi:hypothetical protein EDD16DRAFT_1523830 [Pisolithus croceorrhizus]|nr:hypothetical protein EDD16DRAFT_1523830 [Pisolithus croceorrhizus]